MLNFNGCIEPQNLSPQTFNPRNIYPSKISTYYLWRALQTWSHLAVEYLPLEDLALGYHQHGGAMHHPGHLTKHALGHTKVQTL